MSEVMAHNQFYTPGPAFDNCQADVLLYSFYGGIDSGEVGTMTVAQLLHALPTERVADFAVDKVIDYRSRRPRINVNNWVMEGIQIPVCALDLLTDYSGKKFLVLHGLEPDVNWEQFSQAILEICLRAGIKEAVDLQGIGSGIPHTRPPLVNHISPQAEFLPSKPAAPGNFILPASFGQYLQMKLADHKIKAHGVLVTVPYYIADGQYPPGAVAALEYLAKDLALDLPLGDIEASATLMENELSAQVSGSEEAQHLIKELEEHYDQAPPSAWGSVAPRSLADALKQSDSLKIADRIEDFLAYVDRINDENDAKETDLLAAKPAEHKQLEQAAVEAQTISEQDSTQEETAPKNWFDLEAQLGVESFDQWLSSEVLKAADGVNKKISASQKNSSAPTLSNQDVAEKEKGKKPSKNQLKTPSKSEGAEEKPSGQQGSRHCDTGDTRPRQYPPRSVRRTKQAPDWRSAGGRHVKNDQVEG